MPDHRIGLTPEIFFDLRWWLRCRVKILIVTDSSSGGFGPTAGFHLGQILNILADDPWSHVVFDVTKAHRQVEATADLNNFRFDTHNLGQYSQDLAVRHHYVAGRAHRCRAESARPVHGPGRRCVRHGRSPAPRPANVRRSAPRAIHAPVVLAEPRPQRRADRTGPGGPRAARHGDGTMPPGCRAINRTRCRSRSVRVITRGKSAPASSTWCTSFRIRCSADHPASSSIFPITCTKACVRSHPT